MTEPEEERVEGEEHPRGALTFILIYLFVIVLFWINTYLRLWMRD